MMLQSLPLFGIAVAVTIVGVSSYNVFVKRGMRFLKLARSDQDPVFRELFYTQLLPALKNRGKTVIAISHDDHYFHVADRIIKLDYGQVEYDKFHN
jgi:ABC-type siderophore export system fused ATPase/permease subunit